MEKKRWDNTCKVAKTIPQQVKFTTATPKPSWYK